jgi:hypothetical protein
MATVERRSASHYEESDVVLATRDASGGDRASFTVTVGPADAMREMKMGPADDRRQPKRRRRRRPSKANPIHPDIRELYRYYLEGGWSADDFAAHLGFTRVSIWGWFNNLHYPDAVTRAQIKDRTGIIIHRLSGQR